jgi:hypothetical protein
VTCQLGVQLSGIFPGLRGIYRVSTATPIAMVVTGSVPAGPLSPSPYTQASQSTPTQLTGMGASTLAHLPPAKAGHLNYGLTHLPRHVLSFPHCPIAILRAPVLGLKAPTRQAKFLPTQIHSLLPHIVSPILGGLCRRYDGLYSISC